MDPDRPLAALADYRSWVFDCDGVLLDSNGVKTDAFRIAAAPYGDRATRALVAYHRSHGGVSRFAKADHLFEGILRRPAEPGEKDAFLARFAEAARSGLATCAEAPRLRELLTAIPTGVPKSVVSGSEQGELRALLDARGIARHFDIVLGSPACKGENLARLRAQGLLAAPGVYIGDSREDYEAAAAFGLDFIFVHGWTALDDWRALVAGTPAMVCASIGDLLGIAESKL